jgi:oligopeptide/dipeptide ABC transporter ATP-binding protein
MSQVTVQPPLLDVRGLKTQFRTSRGALRAVDGVDLTVAPGEILGLVGESGSGKSVFALSLLRLIEPPGEIVAGQLLFDGRDVLAMNRRDLARFRSRDIGIIFQQPQGCLNPVRRVGWQVAEPLRQGGLRPREAWEAGVELLRVVGLPAPGDKARAYPHQLSGGQAQRVMIAIALALRPRLLIADEPTTALDVTIQAQILDLLRERCRETATALILVTHDLGVVAKLADRVAVMYAGRIVEEGPVAGILGAPQHPYTRGLLQAAPRLGHVGERLKDIPGAIPDLVNAPSGCAFAPRCETRRALGLARCLTEEPPFTPVAARQQARCWALDPMKASSAAAEALR